MVNKHNLLSQPVSHWQPLASAPACGFNRVCSVAVIALKGFILIASVRNPLHLLPCTAAPSEAEVAATKHVLPMSLFITYYCIIKLSKIFTRTFITTTSSEAIPHEEHAGNYKILRWKLQNIARWKLQNFVLSCW